MADKKENELTRANNFEWVRALDSNGNSIRISKSDLVSVLEGLLETASLTSKGLSAEGFCYIGTFVDVVKISPTDKGWGRYLLIFTFYDNGKGHLAEVIMPTQKSNNPVCLRKTDGNVLVKKDADNCVYVSSSSNDNYNIGVSCIGKTVDDGITISSITKSEYEDISTTDVAMI